MENGFEMGFIATLATVAFILILALLVIVSHYSWKWLSPWGQRIYKLLSAITKPGRDAFVITKTFLRMLLRRLWFNAVTIPLFILDDILATMTDWFWIKIGQFVPWGKVIIGSIIFFIPFGILKLMGAPIDWLLGMGTAGGVLGIIVAPLIYFWLKEKKESGSAYAGLLTVVFSPSLAAWLILFIIAIIDD